MAAKKSRPISFDAVVKLAMKQYQIPTKKDVEKLIQRLDQIERMIQAAKMPAKQTKGVKQSASGKGDTPATASDLVLAAIAGAPDGISFAEIREKTAYPEKKVRNIVFRLSKIGKIKRIERGVYAPTGD